MISKSIKIYIAGHNGMVGSSCWKILKDAGYNNIIGTSSSSLDLRNQSNVYRFLKNENPKVIIDAAAKVGGILANDTYPYNFLMDNMLIQNNLIDAANKLGILKFIFLGSSCIYPKFAPQPLKEDYVLTNTLEPTNQWYALAKITGLKLMEASRNQFGRDYLSLMPTNLYGPNDNFDLETSHVLPAMIRKFHEAKENGNTTVELWGDGSPMREFLHVDDLASAVLFALENNTKENLYNVGTGKDISIKDLSKIVQEIVGHKGKIIWDKSKPNGTPRKLLDITKIKKLGWNPSIKLYEGISQTYQWYLKRIFKLRKIKF